MEEPQTLDEELQWKLKSAGFNLRKEMMLAWLEKYPVLL